MTNTGTTERLHGLDALRAIALLLGVVLHASLSFFPQQIWIVSDESRSAGAAWLFFGIHLFRMTTFFLIAGLFAQLMLARRGWRGFARDRAIRIGGPLLVFWTPVMVGIVAALIWTAHVNGLVTPGAPPPPPPTYGWHDFPLTHLWFLWVLLIFYAALLLVRAAAQRMDSRGRAARALDIAAGGLIGPHTPIVLAVPLAVALWVDPAWIAFFAVPTPDKGLAPNAAALTGFGLAFVVGLLAGRRLDLLPRLAVWSPLYLLIAVPAGVAAYALAGGPRIEPMVEPTAVKALAAAVVSLAVFASALAATGLALRFLSGFSPTRRYLADAAYWVYIVHLPLVMLAQVWVQDWSAPWALKLAIVAVGVTAVSLLSYQLLIRPSFMGRWLGGASSPGRRPRSGRAPSARSAQEAR